MPDYQRSKNNTTNYTHPNESNLWEMHKALEYNLRGQPTLRVSSQSAASAATATSAFGEPLAVPVTPVVQLDAIYGINNEAMQTFTYNGGIADSNESQFIVAADAALGSYSVVRSKRFVRYHPGQGAVCRFACRFTEGVPGTTQRAGFFSQEQAFQFGYNGDQFGILHFHNGQVHLEELTITTEPGNAQTATITLNGVVYNIPLVKETATKTAARIANFTFPGWTTQSSDNKVTFLYEGALQELTNTFSFSSSGDAVGTMTTLQAGSAGTQTWIMQDEWNGQRFDIDPTKFNVFQIKFRWLGAGIVVFSAEHPESGEIIPLHTLHWVNQNEELHVRNPSFRIGFVAYNFGGSSPVTVYGGSIMGAIEGVIASTTYSKSGSVSHSNLSSDNLWHLGTLQNPVISHNRINVREIKLGHFSIAYQGNDPLVVYAFVNASLANQLHEFESVPNSTGIISLAKDVVVPSGTPILAYTIPINGSGNFDLSNLDIKISPGETFTMAFESTQGVSQVTASMIWQED